MARIRLYRQADALRIVLAGALGARDIGRLERACAPVLTTAVAQLRLDLTRVTAFVATARAMIERLEGRGASVTRPATSPAGGSLARTRHATRPSSRRQPQ
jgi:hypothetical protein